MKLVSTLAVGLVISITLSPTLQAKDVQTVNQLDKVFRAEIVKKEIPSFDIEVIAPLEKERQRAEAERIEDERIAIQRAAEEAEKVRQAQLVAEQAKVVSAAPSVPQNDSSAKMFIYMKESGNNPAAVNAGGCRGLGQACPGSKLPCGNDYACQDAYFTNYMLGRYGSWEAAKAFWLAHSWW